MIKLLSFTREFSSKSKSGFVVSRDTISHVVNPSGPYIDEFMLSYGKRPDFRRSDFDTWNSHDKHVTVFWTPKGGTELVSSFQFNYFKHIHNPDEQFCFGGLFWVNPKYRGKAMMNIITEDCRSQNIVTLPFSGSCLPTSMNFVRKLTGVRLFELFKYNVTYYKPDDLRIPNDLDVDGIRVKDFDESQSHNLTQYDQSIFPYHREKLMIAYFSDPKNISKIAYDEDGNVIGFGYLALFESGEAIMYALYADNINVTHAIFANILTDTPMHRIKRFEIRTPDCAYKWIQPFVKNERETTHMATLIYTKPQAYCKLDKVYVNSHPASAPI